MLKVLAPALVAATLAVSVTGCNITRPDDNPSDWSDMRKAIDAETNSALAKLQAQEPSSVALLRRARGVLVFPSVVSAGLLVGGSYGKGELRVNGRVEGYYSTTAASVGLLAGATSKAVYILFLTDEALNKFRQSPTWTVGADASVSVLQAGAAVDGDSLTAKRAVVSYVLTNTGLMANLSIDGTRIAPLGL